ncbi:hypothetical protein N9242_00900 [Vicingaceae bacterium]|nr:hypothetical protein [Vicingaceae bacterium]
MTELTDLEITSILNTLRAESSRLSNKTKSPSSDFTLDFIDIDKFLDVLYSMLDSNNYLAASDEDEQYDKFIFSQEYPDFTVGEKRIITAEIGKRTPANMSANSAPFSGTSVYRPMYLGSEDDPEKGGINLNLQMVYDNALIFTCWSDSLVFSRRLASLFEAIMQKYYYVLRKYVPVIVYTGRGNTIVTDKYADSRYFGIPLEFFVRTNERFILKENELRSIQINYSVENTLK